MPVIHVRLSVVERECLVAEAVREGLSLSEFVRSRCCVSGGGVLGGSVVGGLVRRVGVLERLVGVVDR